ncbi:MAG: YihY/virulence factor BrkB family protein [Propionibacteriaceae bacterium]|nr:YihY/virulence factor BrkB family protein [Propionibacteriaceae bacterium]
MREIWGKAKNTHVVAHIIRAFRRYTLRNGSQLAAGIAYFSFVSIVPVLMLVFSAIGLTLTVIQPQILDNFEAAIRQLLQTELNPTGNPDLVDQIVRPIEESLHNWAALGLVGLAIALWFGSTWMGNLKRAIRVQLRPELGEPEERLPLPLDLAANLGILLVLFVGVMVTFIAMWGAFTLGSVVGYPKTLSVLVSVVAGTLVFYLMFRLFSIERLPRRAIWEGSVLGGLGLGLLQLVATGLFQLLSHNLTAVTFGSVIVLMIFMNLFANLALITAAWIGTWEPYPPKAAKTPPAEPADPAAGLETPDYSVSEATSTPSTDSMS